MATAKAVLSCNAQLGSCLSADVDSKMSTTLSSRHITLSSGSCTAPSYTGHSMNSVKSTVHDRSIKSAFLGNQLHLQPLSRRKGDSQCQYPCQVVSFMVEHSVLIERPVDEVIECILDLPSAAHYDPGTDGIELVTPDIPPTQEGVTYKVKGFVRPLRPLINDLKLSGYVYNKLLKFDPDGSSTGGVPTIVREMKTVQGTGVEIWSMRIVEGGTMLKYSYSSTGFPDASEAETTWEQSLLARLNIFRYFDNISSGLFKAVVVESLAALKEYIEKKATASKMPAQS